MVRREAPRMKRGRAPCCDKTKVKRGPWSPAEDWKLTDFISKYGHENWRSLPKLAGLSRCGKSCRLRWINYLRPDVKRGNFTREEEDTIINLHRSLGNKWSQIASKLPGRTDNEIKNVWNTYLKKRLFPVGDADKKRGKSKVSPASSDSSSSSSTIVSDGEGITGKEIGPQEDHRGSLTKKPGITENAQELPGPEVCHTQEATMEPKKMSSPFVSINNNFNDVTNSVQANVSEPQEQMAVVQGAINDDHQDMVNLLYEQDCDFWKVLDSISFQPEDVQLENAHQGCQSSNFVNARFREVENGNWLQYLETELGLEPIDGKDGNLQGNLTGTDGLLQPLAPDSFHYQNPVQPEMGYGHLWL